MKKFLYGTVAVLAMGVWSAPAQNPGAQPLKISQLPPLPAPLTGTEIFPCDQQVGGVMTGAYGCTAAQISAFTGGGGGGGAGVLSFNARTGAVLLTLGDVTTALTFTPANKGGDTFTGKVNFLPSAAPNAGINLGAGAAPTSPVNGDVWATSAGVFAQIAGATVGPFSAPNALTGDCTTSGNVITCTKTQGTLLTTAATTALGTSGATIPLNNTANVFTGVTYINATIKVARRTASGTITVSATTDYEICVDTTSANATINLPAGVDGLQFLFKDCKGTLTASRIATITPAAGTIDGAATLVMNIARQSIGVTYNGAQSQWDVH